MVFKILLPLIVGILVYFLGKSHSRRDYKRQMPSASVPAAKSIKAEKFQHSLRLVAYFLLCSAILSAGLFVYEDWQASKKEVIIRVINAQTQEITTYQAFHGQIHGRVFSTTDGRQIRLADVERMEVDTGTE